MKNIDHNPKEQASIALKKAQTHIKKILEMIEEDAYCIDILQQLLAVNGLLKSSTDKILKNHLQTCFVDGDHAQSPKQREELVQELLRVMNLANKNL